MRKHIGKSVAALVLGAAIFFGIRTELPVCAEEEGGFQGELHAASAVLMDGDTGRILYGKEEQTLRPMASTTKIMTCILALEHMEEEREIAEVSEYAAGQPKVRLGAEAGERYYLKDLLYSLMLESHNDSAVIIAEHVSGSVEKFAALMNAKAKEIGCERTYFITPNGLDAADQDGTHATTAAELARIMKYCIRDSEKSGEFLEITRTKSYQFQDVSGKRSFSVNNHNAFLDMMEGALSGKTGFTGNAGYCYVGALKREERIFIVALLACGWPSHKNYKWEDTRALMEYGIENYSLRDLAPDIRLPELSAVGGIPEGKALSGDPLLSLAVEDAPEDWIFLAGRGERTEVRIRTEGKLLAPVKKGEEAGTIQVLIGGKPAGKWKLITSEGVERRDYSWCIRRTAKRFLIH